MAEWVHENSVWLCLVLAGIMLILSLIDLALERQTNEFVEAGKTAIKENHGTSVVVSSAYYWEPMDTCPLGCKVQLKTIPGGIATYGEVNERNRKHFSAWAPLPTTRKP